LRNDSLAEGSIRILPGQYRDAETGLHYNYFRDYDPQTGRYVQSDPIGLEGGINPYLYAFDPLRQIDPLGLMGNAPGTFGKGTAAPGTGSRSAPPFPASISVGYGIMGMLGITGGSLEVGFVTNLSKLCGYFQECEIKGLGACIGASPQVGIQTGVPNTGFSRQGGIIGAGGRGIFADAQVLADTENNIGIVRGTPGLGGFGYGGGGGYIECKVTYKCFPQ
jgi:RHS repeat-associated protein